MPPNAAPVYLSAMQRALLSAVAEQAVFVRHGNPLAPQSITSVGWGGPRTHEFRPLGVRMAIRAGWVVVDQTPSTDHPGWFALALTAEGKTALATSAAARPPRRGR